jgi:hypothetical protein
MPILPQTPWKLKMTAPDNSDRIKLLKQYTIRITKGAVTMKVYQENKGSVNGSIGIINSTALYEKARYGLTVHRLKIPGMLRETLCSTNPMESANSACRGIIRRVSNFRDGEMALRHAAAGFIEAERGFRRIKGYRQLPVLMTMLENQTNSTTEIKTA